jgi:4-amino-4-deoxy-L-arabinose transferase-like glycosyltransferase
MLLTGQSEEKRHFSFLLKLFFWIFVIKAVTVFALQNAAIGLLPVEAANWLWSRAPFTSICFKPPGVALEIAFGTFLFGDTEFGVRFGALLFSLFLSFAVYYFAIQAGLEKTRAYGAALLFSVTPIGVFSAIFVLPETGFALFWLLAAALFVKSIMDEAVPPFIKIGALFAIGALFSWAIYLFWLPLIVFCVWQKKMSLRLFATLLFSLILSFLPLVPALLWNASHDYVALKFFLAGALEEKGCAAGALGAFFIAQALLVSPVIFVLLLIATFGMGKNIRRIPQSLAFCFWTFVLFFVAMLALVLFQKIHAHLSVAIYPLAFIMLFAFANMCKEGFMRWIKVGACVSIALVLSAFLLPKYACFSRLNHTAMNPWKHTLGWDRLEKGLLHVGFDPQKHFLISDHYHQASLLSFYSPGKTQSYFLDFDPSKKPLFSQWETFGDKEKEKAGFFVTIVSGQDALEKALGVQEEMKKVLEEYFQDVAATLVLIPLDETDGKTSKVAVVIRVEGYNGKMPTCDE